jgi:hypothetical protein
LSFAEVARTCDDAIRSMVLAGETKLREGHLAVALVGIVASTSLALSLRVRSLPPEARPATRHPVTAAHGYGDQGRSKPAVLRRRAKRNVLACAEYVADPQAIACHT